ncbi:MAG: hemerythrin domain-containing protein [Acidobacteriota bacterium]|nr:hemerythrin domain-containing protein [Acidobacteriota bacterium]
MNAMDMKTNELGITENAIDLLTHDHREVDRLIADLENLSGADTSGNSPNMTFIQFRDNFMLHGQVEEQIFYPALKENPETASLVEHAVDEHQGVKEMLAQMEGLAPNSDEFQRLLKKTKEEIQHHVEEEEREMFVKARQVLSEQKMEELGRQIKQMKDREKPNTASATASM